MVCSVVNIKKQKYNTDIMRGSRYGNPFHITRNCSRKKAIDSFEDYFVYQIRLGIVTYEELLSLNNAILGCCCKPQDCHGDVIAKYVAYANKSRDELDLHVSSYQYKVVDLFTLSNMPTMF